MRSHRRFPLQMHAEVEIFMDCSPGQDTGRSPGETISAMVNTIDVSLGGFCAKVVHSPVATDRSFSPAVAYTLVGKAITVCFKDNGLVVSGRVVRIEPRTMHMAVVITRVSDIDLWRQFCTQAFYAAQG